MANSSHIPFRPGSFGRQDRAPGVVIREITDFALASVLARNGRSVAAATAAESAFGVALPDRPRVVAGPGVEFIGTGPGQWLALAAPSATGIEAQIGAALPGLVSVFEQSDSRVLLEIGGERVRDVLAKGVALDLHPRAFGTGDAALTTVSHLAVQLWQTSDAPTYRLLTVRTYFGSFWHWLASSAAEFGAQVLEPKRYSSGS
ncbi:MAG TPA: sarcosine oxidase subunit gamma family protein [Steroidobacteraceae bacterium]